MATLVRYRPDHENELQSTIPSPFPAQLLHNSQDDILDELAAQPTNAAHVGPSPANPRPTSAHHSLQVAQCQNDIQISLVAVQHSCLMTLANILSLASPPVLSAQADDSEHSSPNGNGIPLDQVLAETPLSCLVHVLRARDGHTDRHDQPLAEAALLSQLHDLVDAIVPSLDRPDAHLAQAIVELLLDLEQLPASLVLTSAHLVSQSSSSQGSGPSSGSPYVTIASLQQQLSSLQSSVASTSGSRPTPAESIRTALFWARIDEQLDTVVSLCRARASSRPQHDITEPSPSRLVAQSSESRTRNKDGRPSFDDALPPEYDFEYHPYPYERPPSYIAEGHFYVSSEEKPNEQMRLAEQYPPEKISSRASTLAFPTGTEMTTERDHSISSNSLDLDTITHAVERLYVVAPQLANQRVELRREKIVQMEKAKEGKGKARTLGDVADPELDKMLELLGRASAREIPDQSAVIHPHRMGHEKGTANIEEQVGGSCY